MKLGIIGCGFIGEKRAMAAEDHDICMVSDLDNNRSAALAAKTGARVATHWTDLLTADIDALVVATPHNTLAEITLAAVQAGKHVLVEKPAGCSVAELLPIIQAAEKNNCIVKVGFNHRFHPAFLKAYELIQTGVLGPLLYIRGQYGHGGRLGYEKEWRCSKEIAGGGELIDQGSHLIDLSRWFLGDLTLESALIPTFFWDISVEDNCFLALRSHSNQIAWLHASWTEWKNKFSFEIYGRHGKLVIDGLGGSYGIERLTHYRMLKTMGPPETTTWEYPFPDLSWKSEVEEFARAIEENRQPIGSLYDAKAMLEIIESVYNEGKS